MSSACRIGLKGEIVAAAVELRAGADARCRGDHRLLPRAAGELQGAGTARLSRGGEFPRTPTGKIHKPGLRQELAQEPASDGTS